MSRPTVLTVVGARPQFIKAAPVSDRLSDRVVEIVVNTGQHYDPEMSDDFFAELDMRPPDVDLAIGSGSHGDQTGRMLTALESVMIERSPGAVQVYGDTNSTLAGALAAAKLDIPVAHVEAGLRSWRRDMPEEVNRVVADHLSTVLLCPTPTAAENLAAEGIVEGVDVVGDVMVDAVRRVLPNLDRRRLDRFDLPERYIAATMHRPANVDTVERMRQALELFEAMPEPVAIAVHPRTAAALQRHGLEWPASVIALPPLGYVDMLTLARYSTAVLTDSGGLQKEAIIVGARCIVLRDETEWVETVDRGMSRLVGLDSNKALDAYRSLETPDRSEIDALFEPGASARVADVIVELASLRRRG